MAGTNSAFDAATFRTNIKAAMRMGSPQATQDKVTFRWKAVKTFNRSDGDHNPYDWSATPVSTSQHADVQVDVAVEARTEPTPEYLSMGEVNAQKIVLTLLDVDFSQIDGANEVLWGQKLFKVDFVAPPIALFEVNVYQIYCTAVDV